MLIPIPRRISQQGAIAGSLVLPASVGMGVTATVSSIPSLVGAPDDDLQASTNDFSVTITSSTAGSTLVLATLRYDRNDVTYTGASDNQTNTWNVALSAQSVSGDSQSSFGVLYASGVAAGTTSVTVNCSGTFGTNVTWVWELTGGTVTDTDYFENVHSKSFEHGDTGITAGAGVYGTMGWFNNANASWTEASGFTKRTTIVDDRQHAQDIVSGSSRTAEKAIIATVANNRGSGLIWRAA